MGGPGFWSHVARNTFALIGIRMISPHTYKVVAILPGASYLNQRSKLVLADLSASIFAATVSMPFNHVFSWSACTPELKPLSHWERCKASTRLITGIYIGSGSGGSQLLARDLAIRISYTGLLFTVYRFVERTIVEDKDLLGLTHWEQAGK